MKKTALLLILCIGCINGQAASLTDLSGGQTGRIEFNSTSPQHPWAMVYRNANRTKPQVVFGDLLMPKSIPANTKVPAVVASHGSDGVASHYYDLWARELTNAGIAVFIVDSYKPRGFDQHSGESRNQQNATENISDALHALKLLATHPQIDSEKIFNIGWSTGGRVAMYGAFPAYIRTVVGAPLKWAGSVAMYPSGCSTRYRVENLGGNLSPLLMLLGGKDDVTPAKQCIEYADKLKAMGNDVTYKVYPNAYHVFDRLNQPFARIRDSHGGDCDMEVTLDPTAPEIGRNGYDFVAKRELKTGKDWGDALKACLKTNVMITVESNPEARADAVKTVINFVKNTK